MSTDAIGSVGIGVFGYATHASGYTIGVNGRSESTTGTGTVGYVSALTGYTIGVRGSTSSSNGTGVFANASAATGATTGVIGTVTSPGGTGVIGYSGTSTSPVPSPKTGVYGRATQDAASRGVYGYSTSGQGVRGQATTGSAGYFSTPLVDAVHTGYALRAIGRVRFDRSAGVAAFNASDPSVTVTPLIDLTASAAVVATITGSSVGVSVVRTSVNATANTFTIYFSGPASAAGKVAWIVIG